MNKQVSRLLLLVGGLSLIFGIGSHLLAKRPQPRISGKLVADKIVQNVASHSGERNSPVVVRYRLTNTGDLPVRILDVSASCGCAKATASNELVEPRQSISIDAEVDPIEVGIKSVSITVKSDSSITPVIGLQTYVGGWRPPPYLFETNGELFFTQGFKPNESREFVVKTIQSAREKPLVPTLGCDLPFVRISEPTHTSKISIINNSLSIHSYRFEVKVVLEAAAKQTFDGRVVVQDPWDPVRSQMLLIHIDATKEPAVIPSRLTITLDRNQKPVSTPRFMVRPTQDDRPVQTHLEGGAVSPLVVIPSRTSKAAAYREFEVRLNPEIPIEKSHYNILIDNFDDDVDQVILPVMIRREE
jgi:hypothetical protein